VRSDPNVIRAYLGEEERAPEREVTAAGRDVDVCGVHARYGNIEALKGVDLEVRDGEIVSLIGANGAARHPVDDGLRPARAPPVAGLCSTDTTSPTRYLRDCALARSGAGRQAHLPAHDRAGKSQMALRSPTAPFSATICTVLRLFPILQQLSRTTPGRHAFFSGGESTRWAWPIRFLQRRAGS